MARKPKHGMSKTRIYQCWADMKTRCTNSSNPYFHRYGGRGIGFCEEWRSFEPFYAWAMSHGYAPDLTLERIDNDKGYSPENCKWATQHEQSMNKSHLPSRTGYVGVRKRGNRYTAEVYRHMNYFYVGLFKTPEEAHNARNEFLRRYENDHSGGHQAASR
jgi:hypothetical protein